VNTLGNDALIVSFEIQETFQTIDIGNPYLQLTTQPLPAGYPRRALGQNHIDAPVWT